MSTGKIILGVVAGAAVGATLGILFAPDKGLNTRKKISKKEEMYLDSLKSKFEDFLATANSDLEDVKSGAENLADKGKEKAAEVKHVVKNKVNEKISTHS